MKRISTILTAILITVTVSAQSPEKMSYQSVVRDASDQLVTNQDMGMQISILQGSASGTVVYIETHSPTTNANGLLSIEIGTGTTSNDFSAIDWASDIYFLKTETDPTTSGGTNYTITGTSQLLSVPYALHAKTVENVDYTQITNTPFIPVDISDLTDNSSLLFDGDYNSLTNLPNLFDGEWSSLLNTPTTIAGYGITDAFSGSYTDLTDKPGNATTSTDGFMSSADKTKLNGLENVNITAGTGISVTGTYPDLAITNTAPGATHYVGESYGGGIIFWLDASGQHGLIAATADQSTGIQWDNGSYPTVGAIYDAVYAGKANTELIINVLGAGSYAAQLCDDYSVTINNEYYGDWYLPSKYELNLLYAQKDIVGGFSNNYYWSSTEIDGFYVWSQYFNNGVQESSAKYLTYNVRVVRAF